MPLLLLLQSTIAYILYTAINYSVFAMQCDVVGGLKEPRASLDPTGHIVWAGVGKRTSWGTLS